MGSCISKCKPKSKTKTKPHQEFSSHVQDKLVISLSQAPLSPIPLKSPRKLPLCPSPSPTYSSSSFSSFSCAGKTNSGELTSSLSSSSSCSSSILCSKDRSFSNEFLWSCVKENPQIIGLDQIKDKVHHPQKLEMRTKPNAASVKQSIPESIVRSTTQKRPRENSPTLTRQKSFRIEPKGTHSMYSRNLRSPSPSRRFNGNNCNHKGAFSTYTAKESSSSSSNKHSVISARKEYVTPASPSNSLSGDRGYLRSRETCTHQIGSKANEVGIKDVRLDVLMDIPMEDIDNPLIALDCFIFL